MEKRFDDETVAAVEAVFDDVERPIKGSVAEVLLTLSAQSANIISLKIEEGVLTLTIAARVVATSLREKPPDAPGTELRDVPPTDPALSSAPREPTPDVEPSKPAAQATAPVFVERHDNVPRPLDVSGPHDARGGDENRQPASTSQGIVFEDLD